MVSVVEQLFHHAEQTPDKAAVIFEGAEISYGELWNKTVRCAHLFRKLGLREGDRVVCQCKYDLFYVASVYAAHICGAAVVPVDKNANSDMIADMAEQIDARLAVCNQKGERFSSCVLYGFLADSLPEDTSLEGLSFPAPESISSIMFTTGTTGAPKGVQITQRAATARLLVRIHEWNVTARNVCISMVPLNHVAPFMALDLYLYCGGTMIFLDGMMKIGRMFEFLGKYGVTAMYLPPSGITLLQQLSKDRLAIYTDQLDYVTTGSAAMNVSQQDYIKTVLPHTRLYTTYASSEAGIVTLYRYDSSEKPINCCGMPCPGVEVRIVDDAFQSVPTGQVGLIAIKSDMVMKGYYKLPELNSVVLHDGFFISGDLGYLDEDGYLYVCGRKDDMINIGGLKVYPSEIENTALKIPGIVDCICFGVPDPVTGQAVKLLIQTDDSFSLSAALVQKALAGVMDSYKVPKSIEIVSEIAKTANGKPDRKYYQQKG